MQAMLPAEHGGMNEVLADVYAITGDAKYLRAGAALRAPGAARAAGRGHRIR